MKAYPWKQRKVFSGNRAVGKLTRQVSKLLRMVAGVLSLGASELVRLVAVSRYEKRNGSWWRMGLLLAVAGGVVAVAVKAPLVWAGAWIDLLKSFGNQATMEPREALITIVLYGLPMAVILTGVVVAITCYQLLYAGERFLLPSQPTVGAKLRRRRNSKHLAKDAVGGDGWLHFGVLVDDPIAWRTRRYGMLSARPVKGLGHGAIVGSNGSGKTVLATNVAAQAVKSAMAAFYIDYKASKATYEAMRSIAFLYGVPFYSFDLGIGSHEQSWYDPLDWEGEAADKASMLVSSFNFPDQGEISFYRNVAEAWLTFQFQVMSKVGIREGESRFDFLYATSDPSGMKERLGPLRKGTDQDRALFTQWSAEASRAKADNLTNLRSNLSTVINSGGNRLRPTNGSAPISLEKAAEEGAVVYVGLSPSTNEVALKIIGSLVLRDVGVLAGVRIRSTDRAAQRPVLMLVDEASRMGNRAVVMENLFTQAREAQIWVWVITQTFTTWPVSTINDMNANIQNRFIFRVPDPETANALVAVMDTIPALQEMSQEIMTNKAFEGEVSEREGGARRSVVLEPYLTSAPYVLTQIPNYMCYVAFTGSHTRATRRRWRQHRPVRHDSIAYDAPLVAVVPITAVSEPAPYEEVGISFSDAAPDVAAMLKRRAHDTSGDSDEDGPVPVLDATLDAPDTGMDNSDGGGVATQLDGGSWDEPGYAPEPPDDGWGDEFLPPPRTSPAPTSKPALVWDEDSTHDTDEQESPDEWAPDEWAPEPERSSTSGARGDGPPAKEPTTAVPPANTAPLPPKKPGTPAPPESKPGDRWA